MSYLKPKSERQGIVGSPQQKAIWKHLASCDSNLVVNALAGSGKTTTIVEGSKRMMNIRTAFVAFGNAIAKELRTRLPHNVPALTLHSLGLRLIRESFATTGTTFDIDDEDAKIEAAITHVQESVINDRYLARSNRYLIRKMVELAKSEGITTNDDDIPAQLEALRLHHGIDDTKMSPDHLYDYVIECLHYSRNNLSLIDFNDMPWLPLELDLHPTTIYDRLLIDEAQDLNAAQRELCWRSASSFCFVGDEFQSIFGFRGADVSSIPNIRECLKGVCIVKSLHEADKPFVELPLTVSRRCPQSVIRLAQLLVPSIEHLPDAAEGTISFSDPEAVTSAVPGDMILCRTYAPLVKATYKFWGAKVPAYIIGRDNASQFRDLIMSLKSSDVESLLYDIDRYEERQAERINRTKGHRTKFLLHALHDRCDCVRTIAANCSNLTEVEAHLNTIFPDPKTTKLTDKDSHPLRVRLSTIHRAKGLEADNVSILSPELIPLPYAKTQWERDQERNLAYVAVTRAKRNLTFLGRCPPAFDLFRHPDHQHTDPFTPPLTDSIPVSIPSTPEDSHAEANPLPKPVVKKVRPKQQRATRKGT